ncbi:cbb3-type cytochrome c oxidase N-terminal domain-containing protein [Mucilaginibacter defluvii]|uniref:Cbb3-type cytochrome c oxidase N-terminal domain-containing protein n=1 Tax=Mucilaginibacter defluvii TaxID=1196019 RepID=A0ABP9G0A4_9SPHI
MKKLLTALVLITTLGTAPVMAADDTLMPVDTMNYIGYGAIMLMLVLFVVTMLVLLRTFKVLTRLLLGAEAKIAPAEPEAEVVPAKPKNSLVNKLLSLRPMAEEESLLTEHDFDGIKELNNPTPAWFMGLFYITIVFAVGYLLVYHVFGIGQLQDQEYQTEMTIANKEKEVFLSKSANRVDENTVTLSKDGAVLQSGATVFKTHCAACHGENGQGVVGPNLTDEYWLHGGKINDVFKTIKYGVQAKGMPNWEKQLTPKQIADVANYIKSIYGTKPAGAKEAQGDIYKDDDAAAKTASI